MIKIKNAKALYIEENKIWIARGMTFWPIDFNGNRIGKKIKIGNSIYNFRLLRQFFRKGIHHFIPLKNGNYFLTLKKKSLILDSNGKVVNVFTGYSGNKPAHRGVCIAPNGYIFFAEYCLNTNRDLEIKLYRSIDNGISFEIIKTFNQGEIRHIHFVEWDKYSNCLWIGTGDYGDSDSECRLYRSFDYGDSFELIGSGSQNWRSIAICPTKEDAIWGTDAGHCKDKNYVFKYNKLNNLLTNISELPGPCHGMCVNKNNDIYISTGVEGGENEKDRYARLYKIENNTIKEIYKIKKDIWPFIIQYGVIRFPSGCENSSKIVYTLMGLRKNGETIYIGD